MHDEQSSDDAHPTFIRATYAQGRLSMVLRHPWFPNHDSWASRFFDQPDNNTVIADLTIYRSDGRLEVVVDELAQADRPDFRMMLLRWATLLGYKRVWIGLDMIDLGDEPPSWDTRVTTTCFGCRTTWRADQTGFWINARQTGLLPNLCALCGQILPVWEECHSADSEPQARREGEGERAGSHSAASQLQLPGLNAD